MATGTSGVGELERATATGAKAKANRVRPEDRAAHEWYRFVLSYPPHLVRRYLDGFGVGKGQTVLDPFCGTGTTLVECKKRGTPSIGIEANRMAHFATAVKVNWSPGPEVLLAHAQTVADRAAARLAEQGLEDMPLFHEAAPAPAALRHLPQERDKLLLKGSISPLPLHKTLVLLDEIAADAGNPYENHQKLALAKALVGTISNLHFGPEVGVRKPKADAAVITAWLAEVRTMASDLTELRELPEASATVHLGDARDVLGLLAPESVDAVITSPPYPNEKDYTRTTRLESVLLGFLRDKVELREMKEGLIRSNTRNVYKADDDDAWVAGNGKVQEICRRIEARRKALGKTSGFERQYHRVTKLYFGGMKRHLAALRSVLRPGAHLAYVVGDQASYLRVMIRTGQLLAEIAESLGYDVVRTDLFRTRMATATRERLREEVLVLRWPGGRMSFDSTGNPTDG